MARSARASIRPGWLTTPILAVSAFSVGSGIAQFGVTAVIGDVAAHFGQGGSGDDLASQIGLPATTVGLALALIRLTSLASLPMTAIADRLGRQRVLLTLSVLGLGVTTLAALAPSFWWYVALVAFARPALSGVNAIAGVVASEETRTHDRSAAIALVTAAYGLGAGLIVVGRSLAGDLATFRIVTAAALLPLLLVPALARRTREPAIARDSLRERGLPGAVPRAHLRSVVLLSVLSGLIALATGPAFSYLFVYGERVLGVSRGVLAGLVVLAGPTGLVGILIGRASADRLGRNVTAAASMAATGVAVAWAYGGSRFQLAAGYLLAIATSSAFAPPTGALGAELVPTRIRATLAGWITFAGVLGAVIGISGFGVLADATGGFDGAARTIGIVTALTAVGFLLLPETRDVELEDLEDPTAPQDPAAGPAGAPSA
jgi:MFS family permease